MEKCVSLLAHTATVKWKASKGFTVFSSVNLEIRGLQTKFSRDSELPRRRWEDRVIVHNCCFRWISRNIFYIFIYTFVCQCSENLVHQNIYICVLPRNVYAILENTQTSLSSKVKCSLLFKYNALYSANIPVNQLINCS